MWVAISTCILAILFHHDAWMSVYIRAPFVLRMTAYAVGLFCFIQTLHMRYICAVFSMCRIIQTITRPNVIVPHYAITGGALVYIYAFGSNVSAVGEFATAAAFPFLVDLATTPLVWIHRAAVAAITPDHDDDEYDDTCTRYKRG